MTLPCQLRSLESFTHAKMVSRLFVLALVALASATDDVKNAKRSIGSFGYPWNSVLGNPWSSDYPWHSTPFAHGSLYPFSTGYLGKSTHFALGTATTHDVAAAAAAAKEATAAAALAHQKVQAAREQVLIQEKVAAAKVAAAQAAIQRSEAAAQVATALQKSEALAAAAAAAHKSAAASAAVAHAAGHYTSVPWISPKHVFHHYG